MARRAARRISIACCMMRLNISWYIIDTVLINRRLKIKRIRAEKCLSFVWLFARGCMNAVTVDRMTSQRSLPARLCLEPSQRKSEWAKALLQSSVTWGRNKNSGRMFGAFLVRSAWGFLRILWCWPSCLGRRGSAAPSGTRQVYFDGWQNGVVFLVGFTAGCLNTKRY